MSSKLKWGVGGASVLVVVLCLWFFFCAGIYLSSRSQLRDRARQELSDARVDVVALNALRSGDVEKPKDMLRQRGQLGLFEFDELNRTLPGLSFWTFALHPFDTMSALLYVPSDAFMPNAEEVGKMRASLTNTVEPK